MYGVGPREVHAHQPVGLSTGTSGVGQRIEIRTLLQRAKSGLDRRVGQARDPQALEGLFAAGVLVDQPENILALATGIGRADDLVGLRVVDQFLDDLVLVGGRARGLELPGLRHHRQLLERPAALPRRAVLVWLGELHQVAQRPGDDIAIAFEIALAALLRAERGAARVRPGAQLDD